jgi:hypothetical protein
MNNVFVLVIRHLKVKPPFYIVHLDSRYCEMEGSVVAVFIFILLVHCCDKNAHKVKFVPNVF